jgi:hypothetical protein
MKWYYDYKERAVPLRIIQAPQRVNSVFIVASDHKFCFYLESRAFHALRLPRGSKNINVKRVIRLPLVFRAECCSHSRALAAAVPEIKRLERGGVIRNQRQLLFIYRLNRDYGLSAHWLTFGVGQTFACRGLKTGPAAHDGESRLYVMDDKQLLTPLAYLLQIPEARQVIQGQVLILKMGLKKESQAFKSPRQGIHNKSKWKVKIEYDG